MHTQRTLSQKERHAHMVHYIANKLFATENLKDDTNTSAEDLQSVRAAFEAHLTESLKQGKSFTLRYTYHPNKGLVYRDSSAKGRTEELREVGLANVCLPLDMFWRITPNIAKVEVRQPINWRYTPLKWCLCGETYIAPQFEAEPPLDES